ncbi:CHAD domain-containing protein [Polaromonas sp. LjRoot131]|uniref:CYTH and CHAD domain-containing protein n=1 Tax=Polaromonas sp. LjRoot131 TaxID=3342262 RepID=UPI003ECEEA04
MEIELKLRLPPAALAALRADPLWGHTRVTHKQLDNIYFDTPQRALAQAGIGLRLRSDGKRWLQTAKGGGSSRAGLHQREEIEFAVAGPALEWAPLAGTAFGPVLEPLKDQLQPQFQTRFKREIRHITGAAGGVIEVAIDEGEILAGDHSEPLCEVELELKGGPVDELFALALTLAERHPLVLDNRSKAERGNRLAHGAALAPPAKAAALAAPPGEDARHAARQAVEACLAHWQANEAGFLAQPQGGHYDSEYLHQLRVAVRRLRVACGPLAGAAQWQEEALAPLQDSLRALGQRLGAARDQDVFIEETWPSLAVGLHDAALRQKLQEAAALRQATARLQAQAALEERDTQRLLLQLGRCLAQPDNDDSPPVPFDEITAQLEKLAHKLRQALPRLEQLSPTRLHRLRITAKKLRYLTEFIAGRYDPQATEAWLEWLKKAQTVFGLHNDRLTARTHIETLCAGVEQPGKLQHSLQAALREQEQPELSLPALPEPYWRP